MGLHRRRTQGHTSNSSSVEIEENAVMEVVETLDRIMGKPEIEQFSNEISQHSILARTMLFYSYPQDTKYQGTTRVKNKAKIKLIDKVLIVLKEDDQGKGMWTQEIIDGGEKRGWEIKRGDIQNCLIYRQEFIKRIGRGIYQYKN
jgi:hypothetical protein